MPRRSPTRPPLPRGRLGSRLLRGAPVAAPTAVTLTDSGTAADTLTDLPSAEELFLRADATRISGLADNDPVTAWPATFGRTLAQATGTLQPTLQTGELNGRPVVRFDGGDSLATTTFAAATQPVTVFVVVRFGTQLTTRYLFDGVNGTDRLALFLNASGQVELFAGVSLIGPAPAAGETAVYTAVFNGASSELYKNGTLVASGNSGGNSLTGLTVGSRFNTIEFLDGDLAEVTATRELLPTGRRQAVEAYLTDKWLPAGPTPVTLNDSAAAADTLRPAAAVPLPDSGAAADALRPAAQAVLADAAAATDVFSAAGPPVAKTLTDAGSAAERLCHDGGPTGAPDCILDSTNLAGPVTSLWDDPQAPDANWLTAVDPTLATDLRVSFPTPGTAPGAGGPTEFQTWLRRVGSGPDPTVSVQLWEAGAFVKELTTAAVSSAGGQLVTATLTPSDLLDPSGAQAELRVRTLDEAGGAYRDSYDHY